MQTQLTKIRDNLRKKFDNYVESRDYNVPMKLKSVEINHTSLRIDFTIVKAKRSPVPDFVDHFMEFFSVAIEKSESVEIIITGFPFDNPNDMAPGRMTTLKDREMMRDFLREMITLFVCCARKKITRLVCTDTPLYVVENRDYWDSLVFIESIFENLKHICLPNLKKIRFPDFFLTRLNFDNRFGHAAFNFTSAPLFFQNHLKNSNADADIERTPIVRRGDTVYEFIRFSAIRASKISNFANENTSSDFKASSQFRRIDINTAYKCGILADELTIENGKTYVWVHVYNHTPNVTMCISNNNFVRMISSIRSHIILIYASMIPMRGFLFEKCSQIEFDFRKNNRIDYAKNYYYHAESKYYLQTSPLLNQTSIDFKIRLKNQLDLENFKKLICMFIEERHPNVIRSRLTAIDQTREPTKSMDEIDEMLSYVHTSFNMTKPAIEISGRIFKHKRRNGLASKKEQALLKRKKGLAYLCTLYINEYIRSGKIKNIPDTYPTKLFKHITYEKLIKPLSAKRRRSDH